MNREQAFLAESLPYMNEICSRMQEKVVTAAITDLRAGKLTPERAVHLWMEINAIQGILKSLETRIKLTKTETVNG